MKFCEMSKEEITGFVTEQKNICEEIVRRAENGEFRQICADAEKNAVRCEYSTGLLHRGYYYPGDIMEIIVSNVGRGRLLKNPPAEGKDYCQLFFDQSGAMIRSERHTSGLGVYEWEFIFRENGVEYGLCCDAKAKLLTHIFAAKYDDVGRPEYTYLYDVGRSRLMKGNGLFNKLFFKEILAENIGSFEDCCIDDMCLYDYDENGVRQAATVLIHTMVINPEVYFYSYDDGGNLLGVYPKNHPDKLMAVKNKSKNKKRKKPAELILEKINNFPAEDIDDIYAVSIYCESNGSGVDVSVGYNTETCFRESVPQAYDEQEARWNCAFWLMNEEKVFDVDSDDDDEFEDIKPAADTLIKAVKELHKSGALTKKFGREIPVIIHELEYYPYIAEINIAANCRELIPDDFLDHCGYDE